MHLIIVDTAGIQPYIFGSNRLRENIGASQLVASATGDWALDIVREVTTSHNVNSDRTPDKMKRIEDSTLTLDAEVIYAGGGNFVALFRDAEGARRFTRELSRKVLTEAPNLQLVIVQHEFDWEADRSLKRALDDTFKQLAIKKQDRALSAPLLGLGVTVMCQSTGLPAVRVTEPIGDDPGYPASSEIHAKIEAAPQADHRLREKIPPRDKTAYPRDFEDLGGSKGEYSCIAVVHADGDGMGSRIRKILDEAKGNRDLITRLRAFSEAVEAAATVALKETLQKIEIDEDGKVTHPAIPELAITLSRDAKTEERFLPFRPIVFGGDDVAFVCDGRLGLSLAIEYLQRFEDKTAQQAVCQGTITACAGIAIVKSHYPFARAYRLAEDLCKSAKTYRRKQSLNRSCLDWHFALSGLSGTIAEIREREYKVKAGSLTIRPVTLGDNPKEKQRTWEVVHKGIQTFQENADWSGRRNKVKSLRDALREGPDAVKRFLAMFKIKALPTILAGYQDFEREGWQGNFCGYFDAIEMADWFIPLEGDGGQ